MSNINPHSVAHALSTMMEMTEKEIQDRFSSLDNAKTYPYKTGKDIVFVPGDRGDRVLLVAHYDTVWSDLSRRETRIDFPVIQSNIEKVGTGADDRCGCLVLWMMRKLGHSLLLLPDEEIGGLGSDEVASKYPEILEDHQFMIQFDRNGFRDLVYYDMETPEFQRYLDLYYQGYETAEGSFTDICNLVPAAGIAGVNVSIGYYQEHTQYEWTDVFDFLRTLYCTYNLLTSENIPSFKPDLRYSYHSMMRPGSHWYYDSMEEDDDSSEDDIVDHISDKYIVCSHCNHEFTGEKDDDLWIYDDPYALCGKCNQTFDIEEGELVHE